MAFSCLVKGGDPNHWGDPNHLLGRSSKYICFLVFYQHLSVPCLSLPFPPRVLQRHVALTRTLPGSIRCGVRQRQGFFPHPGSWFNGILFLTKKNRLRVGRVFWNVVILRGFIDTLTQKYISGVKNVGCSMDHHKKILLNKTFNKKNSGA